jgi:hypothetical protein
VQLFELCFEALKTCSIADLVGSIVLDQYVPYVFSYYEPQRHVEPHVRIVAILTLECLAKLVGRNPGSHRRHGFACGEFLESICHLSLEV